MDIIRLSDAINLFCKIASLEDDLADEANERYYRRVEEGTVFEGSPDLAEQARNLFTEFHEQERKKSPEYKLQEEYERKELEALRRANEALRMENKKVLSSFSEALEYFSKFFHGKDPMQEAEIALKYLSTPSDLADLIRKSEGKETRLSELYKNQKQDLLPINIEDFDY